MEFNLLFDNFRLKFAAPLGIESAQRHKSAGSAVRGELFVDVLGRPQSTVLVTVETEDHMVVKFVFSVESDRLGGSPEGVNPEAESAVDPRTAALLRLAHLLHDP